MRRRSILVPNLFLEGPWNKVEKMQSLTSERVVVSVCFRAILLKNSAARARAFLFDRVQASFSAGCSLFSTVSRGVLEGGRRFRGVSGEFSEVLGGGSEEKFVIGSSGAA